MIKAPGETSHKPRKYITESGPQRSLSQCAAWPSVHALALMQRRNLPDDFTLAWALRDFRDLRLGSPDSRKTKREPSSNTKRAPWFFATLPSTGSVYVNWSADAIFMDLNCVISPCKGEIYNSRRT